MDKELVDLLPESVKTDFEPPRVFYRYNEPIRNIVCNYGKFLRNLSYEEVKSICARDCGCNGYRNLINPDHHHVLTGDFTFLRDHRLKRILSIGPKFRITKGFDKRRLLNEFKCNLDDYIDRLSTRFRIDKDLFNVWRDKFLLKTKNNFFSHLNKIINLVWRLVTENF